MTAKPWLEHYPPGLPKEIDADLFPSLQALLDYCFKQFRDLRAFSCLGGNLSYADVDQQSRYVAAFLQHRGLKPGDRVAVMLPNISQYPVVAFAVLRAGMTVVNVNPLYTPRELEHQLEDSGAKALIILENFANTFAEIRQHTNVEHVVVTGLGDALPAIKRIATNFVVRRVKKLVPPYDLAGSVSYRRMIKEGKWNVFKPPEVGPDDIAFLQYTGGTTGVAKGAMLTHRNMVANVLQTSGWLRPEERGRQEVGVTPLPLYHIFSLTANLFACFYLGFNNVLIPNPRDLNAFIKDLKKQPFSYITGVNTLFNALLTQEDFGSVNFSRLRVTTGGGMAVQKVVADRWKEKTGIPISQGYGLTESSPVVCTNPPGDPFNGSVGLPVPSTDVTIRDDDGAVLPLGEVGEICVKGPQVMKGYWNRPEETANVMLEGGWLKTGDIGRLDEAGRLFIEDRKKDMIIVSGFKVFPNEVEDVVARHPGVLEVAAVGVPDEHSGETVKLFVVKRDPALTEADLLAYCREELTGYKRPHAIEFRDDLPKSNVGKILRRELRDEA